MNPHDVDYLIRRAARRRRNLIRRESFAAWLARYVRGTA